MSGDSEYDHCGDDECDSCGKMKPLSDPTAQKELNELLHHHLCEIMPSVCEDSGQAEWSRKELQKMIDAFMELTEYWKWREDLERERREKLEWEKKYKTEYEIARQAIKDSEALQSCISEMESKII